MASSKENCQNCLQTFYTQSLFPLELVDFKFGGQILTLIGCFMESPDRPTTSDCPKICRTCAELLKTTFIGSEHSLNNRPPTRKPFHICATCSEFFPANVMMSMQLTVVNYKRQSVKLIDCYKTYKDQQETLNGGNLMVCLACVSTIIENYRIVDCPDTGTNRSDELIPVCKVEPDISFDFESEQHVTKIEDPDDDFDGDNHSTIDDSTDIPLLDVQCKTKFKHELPPETTVQCKIEPDWPNSKSFESPSLRKRESPPPRKRDSPKKSSSSSTRKQKTTLSKKYERYDSLVQCAGCGCHKRKSQLERHFISKHYNGKSYSCHHCIYFRTLSRAKIVAHLYTSHFVGNNQCKICQKVLPNYRSLQTHLQKHEPFTSIQCDGCKQVFSRHQTYNLHIQANPLLFSCSKCDNGFHTVRALDKHMETTHKKVYICPICQLPLHLLLTYDTHMWKQHGVRTKPRCRYCGQEFESTEQLAAHRQTEHKPLKAKNIVCELCGKKYDTQYKLSQHIKATHNKITNHQLFTCPQCPKQYKGKIAMAHHVKRVHLNERPANSKMYPCTKCSLTFLKRQFLEGHMLCHNTENRPFFQCMQCGIAYTRRQKLEVHKNKCPNRAASEFSSY